MKTFTRADWERSLREWNDGEFSDKWKVYRHQAAMHGIIFPPEGTKWDSWDDELPSQRAILIRAIHETPTLLHEAIAKRRNWYEIVEYIMRRHEEWREGVDLRDRETTRRRLEEPDGRQATMTLKAILNRIGDS